jgi:hypothetical protein
MFIQKEKKHRRKIGFAIGILAPCDVALDPSSLCTLDNLFQRPNHHLRPCADPSDDRRSADGDGGGGF